MSVTQDGTVELERRGAVALITMRRPQKRNALNFVMRQGLRDAFDEFERDSELRCAVLAAEGSVFSAGGDLKEMANADMGLVPPEQTQMMGSNGKLSKPSIAAVTGAALAGGFYLAQSCDLLVAGRNATFAITEAKRGRGAPWATTLLGMVPRRIMLELLLTAEPLDAQRAYEVGMANALTDDNVAIDTALAMADTIARNAPLSVAAGKRMVDLVADLGPTLAQDPADWLFHHVYTSDDALEGPRAFSEKRQPVWRGR